MTETSRPDDATSSVSVLELVPDSLYAVGWNEPTDDRISFVRPEAGRWLPFQCYVLKDADRALIIDTGVAAHRTQIGTGLDALLAGTTKRDVLLTRYNFDTLSNLPWLTRACGIDKLYPARAAALPLAAAHIIGFMDTFEEATIKAQLRAGSGLTPTAIPTDHGIRVGDLAVEIVRPAVRIQATNWAYESSTKTLFCSDAWGFATAAREGGPSLIRSNDEQIDRMRIDRYFRDRFDWLSNADTTEPITAIETFLEQHRVDRLCPSMGCIVEGNDAVKEVMQLTLSVFADLSRESYENLVVGSENFLAECSGRDPAVGSSVSIDHGE